jgi:CubicO group peptidase (beta-lactamase class C family)
MMSTTADLARFGQAVFGGELVGMDGQRAGSVSSMMRLPLAGMTVVVLANMAPDTGAIDAMRDEAIGWSVAEAAQGPLPSRSANGGVGMPGASPSTPKAAALR